MNNSNKFVDQKDIDSFRREGFHIVSGFLSSSEAEDYRMKINKVFGLPKREIKSQELGEEFYQLTVGGAAENHGKTLAMADGVTKNKEFWPLIFNKRLRGVVAELLGGPIKYTQHSDLSINLGGGRYHRDG